jgi:hypothetical protein
MESTPAFDFDSNHVTPFYIPIDKRHPFLNSTTLERIHVLFIINMYSNFFLEVTTSQTAGVMTQKPTS